MFDFSDDEFAALLLCSVLALIFLIGFYRPLCSSTGLGGGGRIRAALAIVPPICLALLLPVLLHLASHELAGDRGYVVLFLLGGLAWMSASLAVGSWMGVSWRDDAIDRRNSAAAVTVCGAMFGMTCGYAGANVGEGETIWMTFGPAVLATVAWALGWAMLQALAGCADVIAIERHMPSAARLSLFLVLEGCILGYAVAGDYHSAAETLHDFSRLAWPVLPLIVLFALLERHAKPHVSRAVGA